MCKWGIGGAMNRKFILSVLVILLLPFTSLRAEEFSAKAYDLENPLGYKGSKLSIAHLTDRRWLLQTIRLLNKQAKQDPFNKEVYKVRNYLLQVLIEITPTKAEKINLSKIGVYYTKEALKRFPDSHFFKIWYILFFTETYMYLDPQIFLSKVPVIVKSLEDAVNDDPGCCLSLAALLLGTIYAKLPSFPVSVGDIDKGIKYLKIAVKYNPRLMVNHLQLAEAYYLKGEKEKALREIELARKVKPRNYGEYFDYVRFQSRIDEFEQLIKEGKWTNKMSIYEFFSPWSEEKEVVR